jgi:hypothetical protein
MSDEERLFFRCASEVLDSVNSLFRVGGATYANDYYLYYVKQSHRYKYDDYSPIKMPCLTSETGHKV